jgi:hypothetical protein
LGILLYDCNQISKHFKSLKMKLSIGFLTLIICLNLNAQKDKNINSKWFEGSSGYPVPVADDYKTSKKEVLLYCIFNDEKNIYFESKITESIEQNKILQMGLTLWINTDGKSRKITGIRYPLGVRFSKGSGQKGQTGQTSSLNSISPLAAANTIELIGFKNVEKKRFPSNNSDNIRGTVKYDNDGNLLYSLTIPLSILPFDDKAAKDKPVPLNFAVEYGGMPPENEMSGGQAGYTPPAAGARGSSIGKSGSGSSRGGSSGGGGTRTAGGPGDTPESVTVWFKNIVLAGKK